MKTSARTIPFLKTATCPTSATLLSFRTGKVSAKAARTVKEHLEGCDFCSAELPLLAHHTATRASYKVPEIPMDLRILAECILSRR